jgi:hypothetical protein
MRATSTLPRRQLMPMFALAIVTALLPLEAGAQRTLRAGVAVSDRTETAAVIVTHRPTPRPGAPTSLPRRSIKPFLVGGAIVGAVVGGLLAASFNDSFCGEPAPGYSCSSTSPVAGAMIGAGVGLLAGWLVWALTNPGDSSVRGSSR